MITGSPRTENSAWPRQIMLDIPQAPAASNKKQRERLRKQQEQRDAQNSPRGPDAAKEISDDIFHYFTTRGLHPDIVKLLLELSHSKKLKQSKERLAALKSERAKRFVRPA